MVSLAIKGTGKGTLRQLDIRGSMFTKETEGEETGMTEDQTFATGDITAEKGQTETHDGQDKDGEEVGEGDVGHELDWRQAFGLGVNDYAVVLEQVLGEADL